MNGTNKALTALVRSVKRSLKNDHGIEVPHAALRACLLQAQGEHPHAFASKQRTEPSDVAELKALVNAAPEFFHPGYDFDGRKLEWLKRAGLVDNDVGRDGDEGEAYTLYIVADDSGMEMLLCLDPEGLAPLSDMRTSKAAAARVLSLHAVVPKVARYGLPDYYSDPQGFFDDYGLRLSTQYRSTYEDLGDDTGDSAAVKVRMHEAAWRELVRFTLKDNPIFRGQVAEWVGAHYARNFDTESKAKQVEWTERFIDSLRDDCNEATRAQTNIASVTFEYVYPDEDGGSCAASVDLSSGTVSLLDEVPLDVTDWSVRTRICTGGDMEDGQALDVYYARSDGGGQWKLPEKGLKQLKASLSK